MPTRGGTQIPGDTRGGSNRNEIIRSRGRQNNQGHRQGIFPEDPYNRPPDTHANPGPTRRTGRGGRSSRRQPREQTFNAVGSTVPVPYGRVRVGGAIFFFDVVGGNMYIGAAVGWGEIEEYETITLNGQLLATYSGVIYESYYGTTSQIASPLISAARSLLGDGSYDLKHPGLAYIVIRIPPGAGIEGVPDIQITIKGRKVYDPRTGLTEYSTNPYLCIRDLMTSELFGGNIPASKMNDAVGGSIRQSADYADDDIALSAPTTAPTTVDGGLGGNIEANTYYYKISFVDGLGNETMPGPASAGVAITNLHYCDLSSIEIGPGGTVGRNIYRSTSSSSGFRRLTGAGATTITNNTATTFQDGLSQTLIGVRPTPQTSAYTKPRWQIGLVLNGQNTLSDWIDTMRAHAPCWITFNGETYDIWADMPDTAGSVVDFDEDNILGDSLRVVRSGFKDNPTTVTVKYTDQINNFNDASARRELASVTDGSDYRREAFYDLPGCPDGDQAGRTCVYYLNKRLADLLVDFETPASVGVRILPGDLITVTHSIGFTATPFRVVETVQSEDGHTYHITALEYTTAPYTDEIVEQDPGTVGGAGDPFEAPPPPTDLELDTVIEPGLTPYDLVGRIRVNWVNGDTPYYDTTRIEYSYDGGDYIQCGTSKNGPIHVENVVFGIEYTFRLYTISATGLESTALEGTITPLVVDGTIPEVTQGNFVLNQFECYPPYAEPAPMLVPIPAPTLTLANTGFTPCDDGDHSVMIGYVLRSGEIYFSLPATVTTSSPSLDRIDVSDIDDGPADALFAKIYMTKADETTPFYHVVDTALPAGTTQLSVPDSQLADEDLAPEIYDLVDSVEIFDWRGGAEPAPLIARIRADYPPHRYHRLDLSNVVYADPDTRLPRIDIFVRVVSRTLARSTGKVYSNTTTAYWPPQQSSLPPEAIHAQITLSNGANDDVLLPNADYIEIIGPTADFWVTGFKVMDGDDNPIDPTTSRVVKLINKVDYRFSLAHEDTGSDAGARINTPSHGDDWFRVGRENASVTIQFDPETDSRWFPIAFNFADTGPTIVGGSTGPMDHEVYTDPTVPSWSWYNQGSGGVAASVTTESDGSIFLQDGVNSSTHFLRGREYTPGSTPWDIRAAFAVHLPEFNFGGVNAFCGIYIRTSTVQTSSGQNGYFGGIIKDSAGHSQFVQYVLADHTVFTPPLRGIINAGTYQAPQTSPVWARITFDGTYVKFYMSTDGFKWVPTAKQTDFNGHMANAPDIAGFCAYSVQNNASADDYGAGIRLLSWSLT